ncbi:hypothetical protein AVEN_138970-1 [Araneus ventricosus]|uniref:Uncharacterized protein n=1 Tax=Araneus ventricosus TaxID=182803 RepID=A0A4Y2SQ51_ARAVE|nr:hypothetical protein AVEN_138970-1 [Araneus ventricosus]
MTPGRHHHTSQRTFEHLHQIECAQGLIYSKSLGGMGYRTCTLRIEMYAFGKYDRYLQNLAKMKDMKHSDSKSLTKFYLQYNVNNTITFENPQY